MTNADFIKTLAQDLHHDNANKSISFIWAQTAKYILLFHLRQLESSPTMFVRNSKKILNSCGWFNAATIYRKTNGAFRNKQDCWRWLQANDCHPIKVGHLTYYRLESVPQIKPQP